MSDPISSRSDELLPDPAVSDAAADYVENAVGRFYFKQHWAKVRDQAAVTEWLRRYSYDADPASVVAELDRLAAAGDWAS